MAANSALDRVLDQAQTAADGFQAPAAPATGGALATQTAPGQLAKPSMAAVAESGGISVDDYLRMDQAGFQLGDMKKYFEEFEAELDMTEVIPIYSARGEAGGNTKFLKSYDGLTEARLGTNFQQAVAHLEATTKCSGIYQTVEIPLTLLDDVKDTAGTVGATEGARIGITPSVTGFKEFQSFYRQLQKQGLQEATVKVRVKHLMRTNKNNNKWGVATFELLEKIRD